MSSPASLLSILVFSATTPDAYRHACIPAALAGLHRFSNTTSPNLDITATEDPSIFSPSLLSAFRVIVFLQASGTFLDDEQLAALQGFVRNGGGVVGVHAGITGMPGCEWYAGLMGGVFVEHPEPQWGMVRVENSAHVIHTGKEGNESAASGDAVQERKWFDEWYNFDRDPRREGMTVLLTVDEKSYEGGKHGADHPLAWCHEFEGARVFFTALGHFDEAYQDEWFMGQLVNGILWAGRES
jgi:type 1 glutamine amidotransferase